MAKTTEIAWADSTFNPWIGCTKVSTAAGGGGGCDGCYAAVSTPVRVYRGKGIETWGPGAPRQRTSAAYWQQPIRWNDEATEFDAEHGHRRRVFCASLADVFDNEVDPAWREDLFALIHETPRLDWLLLTKRIGNVERLLPTQLDGVLPRNVWLGATVVNQVEADRDVPKLLATAATVRFLSIEPMLGPIDLERPRPGPDLDQGNGQKICQPWLIQSGIDWVIAGGESGAHARPAHIDWFRSLRDQCAAAQVPFLFKQWGEWAPDEHFVNLPRRDDQIHEWGPGQRITGRSWRYGKVAAGRLLDGVEHNAFPGVA